MESINLAYWWSLDSVVNQNNEVQVFEGNIFKGKGLNSASVKINTDAFESNLTYKIKVRISDGIDMVDTIYAL